VVTYTTIVDFDNPDMKLFPGMTAYINIPVATANDVVKVPNTALRYTPDLTTDELAAAYAKNGITATAGKGRKSGQQEPQTSGQAPATLAVIWKMGANKQLEPVQIKLGITDHTTTEVAQVLKGSLSAGDQVITGLNGPQQKAGGSTATPGMGGARGGAGGGMRVGR
jgi:HlyD family secretion protein